MGELDCSKTSLIMISSVVAALNSCYFNGIKKVASGRENSHYWTRLAEGTALGALHV